MSSNRYVVVQEYNIIDSKYSLASSKKLSTHRGEKEYHNGILPFFVNGITLQISDAGHNIFNIGPKAEKMVNRNHGTATMDSLKSPLNI